MVLDRMDDSDYSEADAAVVMENSDAYCPGGGKYTLEWNELYIKVTCNIHGSTSSGMDGDINVSSKFIDDYRDFTIEYLKDHPTKNNDEIRKAFLEKYNGKWPTLIVDKKSYSIQPFYQGKDKTKPVEDCVWLFARANGNADAGWSVPYVYNIVDGNGMEPPNGTVRREEPPIYLTRIRLLWMRQSGIISTQAEKTSGLR